jgi:hypothetical protein
VTRELLICGRKEAYLRSRVRLFRSWPTQLTSTHHRLECRKAAKSDFGELGGAKSTTLAE